MKPRKLPKIASRKGTVRDPPGIEAKRGIACGYRPVSAEEGKSKNSPKKKKIPWAVAVKRRRGGDKKKSGGKCRERKPGFLGRLNKNQQE